MSEIRTASTTVEAWVRRVGSDGWLHTCGSAWTNKDLLGHLAAWSDFLIDQVEALRDERPGAIEAVDVDSWNAVQVARRRGRPAHEAVDEWRHAVQRATEVVGGLPAEAWHRRWLVAWGAEPIAIDDLLRLWLVHIEQHQSRLAGS